ncbi:hypothetical protein [Sabulicella rubraurantiaca]|uniref:hypothetical protein n=1 Tax=Sabulicella rubraurantiaca TaxID=2811429 RepID=UPI001A9778CF|nr:hypothetical protein [Sabulicella rubraurantiaca]
MNLIRRGVVALLLVPGLAGAQSARSRGPNGGLVVIVDGHPVELVASGTEVILFVSDEQGRPSSTRQASGRLTIQAEGRTSTVTLRPAEPNRLVGALQAPLASGARLVFNGTIDHGHRVTARYVIE